MAHESHFLIGTSWGFGAVVAAGAGADIGAAGASEVMALFGGWYDSLEKGAHSRKGCV